MQGLHLIADMYCCACPARLLTEANELADLCRRRTREAGLCVVDEKWHPFPAASAGQPGGVTGVLLLAESHLAVHTWPEIRAASGQASSAASSVSPGSLPLSTRISFAEANTPSV